MTKTLLALVALTALVNVEHDKVLYGPGQPAGTDFEATAAQARTLLGVNAVKLRETDSADGPSLEQLIAAGESVDAAHRAATVAQELALQNSQAAADAQAKADADAQAAADAQAKADADAQAVAEARAKLEADVKAFEDTKAAAAKAAKK
jgi:hypothetical protein